MTEVHVTLRLTLGNLFLRSFHTPDVRGAKSEKSYPPSSWGFSTEYCLRSERGAVFLSESQSSPANMGLHYCTEFLPNPHGTVGVTTVLRSTWSYFQLGRSCTSGGTTELSILEFYLYTYSGRQGLYYRSPSYYGYTRIWYQRGTGRSL